jgi:hypothetical protein
VRPHTALPSALGMEYCEQQASDEVRPV